MARRFHDTLAAAAADVCAEVRRESGADRVVLSGGVFQNKLLTEALHDLLTAREFRVYTHRLVPPNDGGLALGQAAVAGRRHAVMRAEGRGPVPPPADGREPHGR